MPVPTPLPMHDAPVLSPCVVCRRRFRVNGKPVFDTCFCLRYGRRTTVSSLTLTAAIYALIAATFAALAVIVARTPYHKKD